MRTRRGRRERESEGGDERGREAEDKEESGRAEKRVIVGGSKREREHGWEETRERK